MAVVLSTLLLLTAEPWLSIAQEPKGPAHSAKATAKLAAELVLYPGSRIHPLDLVDLGQELDPCPRNVRTKKVTLALDTCLSGEYYLHENFEITKLPACDDRSKPTVRFYQRRGCVGEVMTPEIPSVPSSTCLWSQTQVPNPSYYWSLIISCGQSPFPDAERYQDASPPAIVRQRQGGTNGQISSGLACDMPFLHPHELQDEPNILPDQSANCWNWNLSQVLTKFVIYAPAICPDGSRARLAWVKDIVPDKPALPCTIRRVIKEDALTDINDEDLGRCVGAWEAPFAQEGQAAVKGVLFYCGGAVLPPVHRKPVYYGHLRPAEALVLHNGSPHNNGSERTPTIMPVAAGSCVNLPPGKTVVMYSNAVCADRRPAHFARWRGRDCQGPPLWFGHSPDGYSGNGDRLAAKQDEMMSYSFWCEGIKGILKSAAKEGRAVYSDNACGYDIDVNYSYEPPNPPPLDIVDPGSCTQLYRKGPTWKIFQNAICPDGKPAMLGLWFDSACSGPPLVVEEVQRHQVDTCQTICPGINWPHNCSRAFLCGETQKNGDAVKHGSMRPYVLGGSHMAGSRIAWRGWFWWTGVFIGLLLLARFWRIARHSNYLRAALQMWSRAPSPYFVAVR